jgi:hypothetical protein
MDKYILEYLESKIQTLVSKKALKILRSRYENIVDLDFYKFGKDIKYNCPTRIYYKGMEPFSDIQKEYTNILDMEVKLYLSNLIDKLVK